MWKSTTVALTLASCILAAALAWPATAQADQPQDGWTLLFDGQSLEGWTNRAGEEPGAGWVVEDGAMVRQRGAGDIWTKERFGDFVLDLEFHTQGNSGVFIRTDDPKDNVQTGIEIQVERPGGPSRHSVGAVYDLLAPSKNAAKEGWNHLVITARDNLLQVQLNGEQIIDMDLDRWTEAGKNPDGSRNKFRTALKDFKREGHIGFQDHGAEVQYRNVRIKRLDQAAQKLTRQVYVAARDGAGGTGDKGIYVYDIDNGHQLVRFIEMPQLGGTRGACACAATNKMWISHGNDKLLCLDLKTDQVLWEVQYPAEDGGADRIGVTPDGQKLYVPGGWWNSDPCVRVVEAETGRTLKKIAVASKGGVHNLIVSHDGRRVFVGSVRDPMLSVIDTQSDEVIQQVGPIIGVIQPLTVNGALTRAYINSHLYREGHGPGFEIGDIATGEILHVVGRPELSERQSRCHGIGLTPDEKEVWVVDQGFQEIHVFDNTVSPPKFQQAVPMAAKTHGWICFSRDGRYAWCDTGEVFDAATKKVVARWTDQPGGQGNPVMNSKFFEIHFRGDEAVFVGQQMGVGYGGTELPESLQQGER